MTTRRHDDETIRRLKALGQAFREARKEAGLTQAALGERCGLHQASIRRIEAGGVDPGYEVMQTLAAGMGVPLHTILDRADELAGK